MIGILLSLVPLITWGVGDYIASRFSKRVPPYSASVFYATVGFFFSMSIVSFYPNPVFYADRVIQAALSSIFISAGFLTMLKGFHYGPVGIVASVANAYAIVTAAISIFVFGQSITVYNFLGICVVILGIFMISYTKPKHRNKFNLPMTVVFSLLALIFFGVGFAFFERSSVQEWPQNMAVYQLINLPVAISIWLIFQRKEKIKSIKLLAKEKLIYLGGICGSGGQMAMFAALKYIPNVAILAAIAAAAPLVTSLLAYKIDKEHLTILQRFATIIIVVGIIMLSIK